MQRHKYMCMIYLIFEYFSIQYADKSKYFSLLYCIYLLQRNTFFKIILGTRSRSDFQKISPVYTWHLIGSCNLIFMGRWQILSCILFLFFCNPCPVFIFLSSRSCRKVFFFLIGFIETFFLSHPNPFVSLKTQSWFAFFFIFILPLSPSILNCS